MPLRSALVVRKDHKLRPCQLLHIAHERIPVSSCRQAQHPERQLVPDRRRCEASGLIGRYVADFYCAEARLVVEVHGAHHGEPDQIEHDEARDDWMTAAGLNVLRFTVHEVLENLEEVKQRIWSEASDDD